MAEPQPSGKEPLREGPDPLTHRIRKTSRTPGSSIRMGHEQGKTAVYLSDDGNQSIEHEPIGNMHRKPLHSHRDA